MNDDNFRLITQGKIVPFPAVFEDWPLGGIRRGRMTFTLEESKRGQRVHRAADGAKGRRTTYANRWYVVACADGKTRLVRRSIEFGKSLTVYDHTGQKEAFRDATITQDSNQFWYIALDAFLNAQEVTT